MRVIRTSYEEGKSYGGFQWPETGLVEAPDWDPKPICGGGLHGVHLKGSLSTLIQRSNALWQVVEIDDKDVIDLGRKVKFPKGNVIFSGDAQGAFEAWLGMDADEIRQWICKDPEWAYFYALYVDEAPWDDMREAALRSPKWACYYARHIDKSPREDTRNAVLGDPERACRYALNVDKGPREDTRKATLGDPGWAYRYALNVDKGPRDDTRNAVLGDPKWAYHYARYMGE